LGICVSQCETPKYLYQNNDCNDSCPDYGIKQNISNVMICKNPCSNPDHFYHFETDNCQADCIAPNISNTTHSFKTCSLPPPSDPEPEPEPEPNPPINQLSPEEVKEVQGLADVGNAAGTASSVGLTVAGALSPGDPGGISAGALTKMLQYSKYLNITYTPKLELMFLVQNKSSGPMGIAPKMSDELKKEFNFQHIPIKFAQYQVHSSFIINFWDSGITLCIMSGIVLLLRAIEYISFILKKKYLPPAITRLLRTTVQNFMFIQLYGNFGDIILFSMLELQSSQLDSAASILSTLSAIIMMGIAIISLTLHIKILNKYQNIKKENVNNEKGKEEIESFEKDYAGVQVVFGAFKDSSFSSQGYLFFFILRSICTNLALAFLYPHPMAQSIIMMLLTLAMVVYLGIKRPFKIIVNQVQQITFEMMLLTVNIILVILSIMDAADSQSSRDGLSQVILTINLLFGFLPPAFLVAKVVFMGLEYYKEMKLKKANGNLKPQVTKNQRINKNLNQSIQQTESLNTEAFIFNNQSNLRNLSNQKNSLSFSNNKTLRINQRIKRPPLNSSSGIEIPNLQSNDSLSYQTQLNTSKNNLSTDHLLDISLNEI